MPSVEKSLYDRLIADSTISSLVGTRVYPVLLPQDPTYPAVTFNRISTERIQDLAGSTGLTKASFQVSAWSTNYSEVLTVASGIRSALDGNESTRIENQLQLYDQDAKVHHAALDFVIWHTE